MVLRLKREKHSLCVLVVVVVVAVLFFYCMAFDHYIIIYTSCSFILMGPRLRAEIIFDHETTGAKEQRSQCVFAAASLGLLLCVNLFPWRAAAHTAFSLCLTRFLIGETKTCVWSNLSLQAIGHKDQNYTE